MRYYFLAVATCCLLSPVFAAAADQPRLVCASRRTDNADIFLLNADGTGVKNLTNHPAYDHYPAPSPDGKKIVFQSQRHGVMNLFVMDADGSNVKQLTSERTVSQSPCWSPDGKQIAFSRTMADANHEIFIMNADGSNPVNLTNDPAWDSDPAWSPNGKKIVFTSNRAGGGFRVYTIDVDRGFVQALTTTDNNMGSVFPSWSPDGKKVVYGDVAGGALELFVCNANGTGHQQLTKLGGRNSFASWSPDGKQIAFQHIEAGGKEGTLYLIDADGSNPKQVLDMDGKPFADAHAAWLPK